MLYLNDPDVPSVAELFCEEAQGILPVKAMTEDRVIIYGRQAMDAYLDETWEEDLWPSQDGFRRFVRDLAEAQFDVMPALFDMVDTGVDVMPLTAA